jgi:hypothetical protein
MTALLLSISMLVSAAGDLLQLRDHDRLQDGSCQITVTLPS